MLSRSVIRVLHVLPHTGGGGELHVDLLARMPGTAQGRLYASASRSPARALAGLPRRRLIVRRAAADADLVHAHGDMTAVLISGALAHRASVWTTHGLSFTRRSSGAAHKVFENRLRRRDPQTRLTICTTEAERGELAAIVGDDHASRLRVIANGLEPAPPPDAARRERVRADLGVPSDEVVALFAGRLDDAKGVRDAVEAVAAARRAGTALTLLVAGDGPLAGVLREQGADGVRLLGHRTTSTSCSALPTCSCSPRGGRARRMPSSKRFGPASRSSSAMDWEIPRPSGTRESWFRCGDIPALAGELADLAARPERRRALGDAARARAEGPLGLARFLSDMRSAYDEALSGVGRPTPVAGRRSPMLRRWACSPTGRSGSSSATRCAPTTTARSRALCAATSIRATRCRGYFLGSGEYPAHDRRAHADGHRPPEGVDQGRRVHRQRGVLPARLRDRARRPASSSTSDRTSGSRRSTSSLARPDVRVHPVRAGAGERRAAAGEPRRRSRTAGSCTRRRSPTGRGRCRSRPSRPAATAGWTGRRGPATPSR